MDKKILSYIGLCQKAGFLISGEESCEKAIASGKAYVVIISEDASENTKKKFSNKCMHYGVRAYIAGQRDELSSAIGKVNRPVVIISDKGLSEKIIELLEV